MKEELSEIELLMKIKSLEERLEESEQLIDAIKSGSVDAFALNRNDKSEIFTLESGDYAYRMLVENFGEGALNLSEDGLIVYTNNYFHNLLGLPYDKVIGHYIFEFIHPDSKQEFENIFKKAFTGKSKGEVGIISGDNSLCAYVSLTSLYPTLPTIGMIVTDLTEKKDQEKILERKNQELLNANAELASFAYVASHDLQEPLRKIQTFSTRIVDMEVNNLSEGGKDYFRRMQLAAKRMQTLIEDLLAYSRTNAGERKFEYRNMHQIIDEVKTDLKEELQQKNATLEFSEMCSVSVIPYQFRQLLNNLISNSLKFANPDKSPKITINSEIVSADELNGKVTTNAKEYCHISITDNGIGFEQQYSEKIFDLFQQLNGKSEYPGTGIGLAIVKKIVENHNGIISATSEPGNGATFDIYIPELEADEK